jgi:hypothetical protein
MISGGPQQYPNKEHAASCCSGSDGNDYAYVEDLLYAGTALRSNNASVIGGQVPGMVQPTSASGSVSTGATSTFGAVQHPAMSSASWCPQSIGMSRKDIGTTATMYGGGGRVIHHML